MPTGTQADPNAAKKAKFDPNTLTPELRPVYDEMLADYTRGKTGWAKEKEAMAKQIAEIDGRAKEALRAVQYYERLLPQLYDNANGGVDPTTGQPIDSRGNGADRGVEDSPWNPFDPNSHRLAIKSEIAAYHKQLTEVYNGLVKGIMELQAYNLQLMRVQLTPIAQKLGIELPDVQKIVEAAPQYGYNLEQAYRAVYESPGVWKNAQEYPNIVKERDELQAKLKTLESRTPNAGVLGGTTGPVPRTVAKGQKPRTYAEIAASISPGEVFAPEEGGSVSGTAGAGGGGTPAGQ